ncbi:MAG: hypothetical protein DMG24_17775 [Acidobacteria bacterium]|nr:MAG: hypothetical protein DMG24_17775 [Acidobacteriota bacterium]
MAAKRELRSTALGSALAAAPWKTPARLGPDRRLIRPSVERLKERSHIRRCARNASFVIQHPEILSPVAEIVDAVFESGNSAPQRRKKIADLGLRRRHQQHFLTPPRKTRSSILEIIRVGCGTSGGDAEYTLFYAVNRIVG